jgi:outer membrane protein OmpA-like peptidoglycan-associated protein
MQLKIGGFTDKLGSFEHNLVLSENRADTIRNYMIDRASRPATSAVSPASPGTSPPRT